MGSSRPPDHSLGSGISFPQWMRGRVDSRFDFDQNTFSPPSHDDSFFCIRYTKSGNSGQQQQQQQQQEAFRAINEVLNESKPVNDSHTLAASGGANISNIKKIKDIDFSKHPLPCQPYVPVANKEREGIGYQLTAKSPKLKSQRTDDGFHGESALCGKSIVNVAARMMIGSLNKKSDNQLENQKMDKHDVLIRKGSQSLPVTPIASPTSTPEGSPKSRRRGNRYFTGAFIPDRDKYQGGWLLGSILSQSRETIGNKIEEEEEIAEIVPPKILNRKKSISSQNLSYFGKEDTTVKNSITQATVTFQAKPSELREMNFWSPTSM